MKVTVGSVPPEAELKGSLNAAPPMAQREADAPKKKVEVGPQRGGQGEYLPATYALKESENAPGEVRYRTDR